MTLTDEIIQQLFEETKNVYEAHERLTDGLLSSLRSVFQGTLMGALTIIDRNAITHATSPSGRDVFQVINSSGEHLTILPTSNYCSCEYYKFSVLLGNHSPMCKHVLATRLSTAMNKNKEVAYSDETVSLMIANIIE